MTTSMSKLARNTSFLTQRLNSTLSTVVTYPLKEEVTRDGEKENFRKLKIPGVHKIDDKKFERRKFVRQIRHPRYNKMKVDQDWTNVWPTAATFKWSVVPFPVRQGAVWNKVENKGITPDKYANAELMKIPNFLHLTPQHIKKQCASLKELCNPWPEGLTSENMKKYFPVVSTSSNFCFSSNTIRDPRAREVTVKFELSSLRLDKHGEEKFQRLVGDRYNKEDDMVTLKSDRCPLKTQNYDYIMYLITVLYIESMTIEPWEKEITVEDMFEVPWELTPSKNNLLKLLDRIYDIDSKDESTEVQKKIPYLKQKPEEETINGVKEISEYQNSVFNIINKEETEKIVKDYKNSVLELLNIPKMKVEH